ncbi:HAD-IA family hydrolase [Algibacillus agarilyticus]|uniref:HAD-IA family hydrolase n=1 Tax=Algibacillus agarilyticus TaxID=2234133 RepID=UPI000DD02DE7|nr:HAD-IA family hydrolase [Algibacillus agarilyticus]
MAENLKGTLIFDFDGTLADTLMINLKILNELSSFYQFKYTTPSQMQVLRQLPANQVLKKLGINWFKVPWVMRSAKKKLNQYMTQLPICEDLKTTLFSLQKQYQLGIVTTNSRENVDAFLVHNRLGFFDFIYADAKLLGKNFMLKRVLRKEGLSADNTFYIGDELRDIIAAQRCSLQCLSVCWGYNSRGVLIKHNPNNIVEAPQHLLTRLGT